VATPHFFLLIYRLPKQTTQTLTPSLPHHLNTATCRVLRATRGYLLSAAYNWLSQLVRSTGALN